MSVLTIEQYRELERVEEAKPHKYGAKPCSVDGIYFRSQRQAKRYGELVLLERKGIIKGLKIDKRDPEHVRFPLEVNGFLICYYEADAVYEESGKLVVEDSKGVRTAGYKLKKKLMKAIYGIEILET